DGSLAGSYAVRRLFQVEREPVWERRDARAHRRGAVPQLRLGGAHGHVETAARVERRACERGVRADDDGVRPGVGTECVERSWRRDPEPAPLPRRETPKARVATELDAVLVDDCTIRSLEPAASEERAVVVAGEKARLLALGPARCGQTCSRGFGASLVLRLAAERKDDAIEQRRVEPPEHVGLILLRVRRTREQAASPVVDDPGVVAGRQPGGTGATRERKQLGEPEAPVAADAGVRRLAARVAADERFDDGAPERVAKVERHVGDAEPMTGRARC